MRFYFAYLDLDGRSGERDVFVIFLLLASADSRFYSPMVELLGSFLFICKTQAALEMALNGCEPALINVINHLIISLS